MMKVLVLVVLCASGAFAGGTRGDQTMSKVVHLLQEMLETSQDDGRADREIFAKFKCYCDKNTADKTTSIAQYTKQIAMLEGEIEELSANSGKLSTEVASLTKSMADNEAARADAEDLRKKANEDFLAEEKDMTGAIEQMDKAIETLGAIGADQTAQAGLASVHSHSGKFMGSSQKAEEKLANSKKAAKAKEVAKLSAESKKILKAASAFLPAKERKSFAAFLQAPFTGEYSAQSGEIVGILKNMRDTFKQNLGSARAAEKAALRSFNQYTETMTDAFNTMNDEEAHKQGLLGTNDESLEAARGNLEAAIENKDADEVFLADLTRNCADKTAEYEDLKMVRANEEAAVAKAISILNSDAAFENFGNIASTSTGATGFFLQLEKRNRDSRPVHKVRGQVAKILSKVAKQRKSLRLAKIASQAKGKENPFGMVIRSVKKQMKVIDEEEKADDDTKSFCDSEREKNDAIVKDKTDAIGTLDGEIADITDSIENPETGLKASLAAAQESLRITKENQASETSSRAKENAEYRKNVQNLVQAEETIDKALKVLNEYYAWLKRKTGAHHYDEKSGKDSGGATIRRVPEASVEELEKICSADPNCAGFNTNGVLKSAIADEAEWYDTAGSLYVKVYDEGFLQLSSKSSAKARKEDPPATDFKGGQESKGNDALGMLEFILEETKAEEKTAHENEEKAQAAFEDEMTDLTKEENDALTTIAKTEEDLAKQEQALALKKSNHAAETKEKEATEAYLLSIKPGCDFMDQNIDARKDSRRAEKSALEDSRKLMEGTPEYQAAVAEEEAAELGDCKEACFGEDWQEVMKDLDKVKEMVEHVDCKVCQSPGSSVEGYCAANPDTPGC